MCSKAPARGFTLIEMILAMVILSVGIAGVLAAFRTTVGKSDDPRVAKQMLAIAQEMMEEVQLKTWKASGTAPAGCGRASAVYITDYNGYNSGGQICDIDGNALAADALSGYGVTVSVADTTLGGITEAKKITVTVTRGSDSVQLVGWRTNYAGP